MAVDMPEITGGLLRDAVEGAALRVWLASDSTGEEYGHLFTVYLESLAALWGVVRSPSESVSAALQAPTDELQRLALAMASEQPFVVDQVVEPVHLTDELMEDVQQTTGLTYRQIARIFGISERAVAGWKQTGVPRHREELMRALRSIGLILVGALGANGVSQWLGAGDPSRLQRLSDGDIQSAVEEARAYEFSPAT